MNKTILITGASGFIGSHLCDFFILKNYNVIGLDNLITGDINNLKHCFTKSNFKFYNLDINDNFHLDERIDYILHFASPASPIDYLKIPIETLRTGSLGTENVLKIALKNKSTILIASTSEVYGDPLVHPQHEGYLGNVNPIGPRGVYDEAKRFQEAITMAYHTYYNLDIRIARIFNTYGPKMKINDGRAIPTFLKQLIKKEPITVFGDGNQTRSFCYIDDLLTGIYSLLLSDYCFPVNLGNPHEITLNNLIKKILNLKNFKNEVINLKLPEDDPKKRRPDISLAKKILNWEPKTSLNDGLNKTLDFFETIIN